MGNRKNGKPGRTDPKRNKSLAIRNVLKRMPRAKASEIAAVVKNEYGLSVSQNMVYMVKTKTNMFADGRAKRPKGAARDNPMHTPALWIDAIKTARQLLSSTGSYANAVALLKAVES